MGWAAAWREGAPPLAQRQQIGGGPSAGSGALGGARGSLSHMTARPPRPAAHLTRDARAALLRLAAGCCAVERARALPLQRPRRAAAHRQRRAVGVQPALHAVHPHEHLRRARVAQHARHLRCARIGTGWQHARLLARAFTWRCVLWREVAGLLVMVHKLFPRSLAIPPCAVLDCSSAGVLINTFRNIMDPRHVETLRGMPQVNRLPFSLLFLRGRTQDPHASTAPGAPALPQVAHS